MAKQPPAAAAHAQRLPGASSAPPAASQESPAGSAHSTAVGHSRAGRAAGPDAATCAAGNQLAMQAVPLPALADSSSSRAGDGRTTRQVSAPSVAAVMHTARLAAPNTAAMTAELPLQIGTGAQSQHRQYNSLEVSASGGILGCSRAVPQEPRAATAAYMWISSAPAAGADSPAAAAAAAAPSPELQPSRAPEARRPLSEGAARQHRLKRQRRADAALAARARPALVPCVRPALDVLNVLLDAHSLQILDYMPGKQHALSAPYSLYVHGI